jgi:hypothetical protein
MASMSTVWEHSFRIRSYYQRRFGSGSVYSVNPVNSGTVGKVYKGGVWCSVL